MTKMTETVSSSSSNEIRVTPLHHPMDRTQNDVEEVTFENGNYHRRVLQRMVTALPWSHFSPTRDDGDLSSEGEVEICLEEYYYENPSSGPGSATTVESHPSPLFRRVAVRSYGPLGTSTSTVDTAATTTTTTTSHQVMHASFILPLAPLPFEDSSSATTHSHENLLSSTPLMCWTQFKDYSGYRLCVLASSTSLHILDVYPQWNTPEKDSSNNSSSKSLNGDCTITLTLPFPVDSIFSLPLPYGGVLLQRMLTKDETREISEEEQGIMETEVHSPMRDVEDMGIAASSQQCNGHSDDNPLRILTASPAESPSERSHSNLLHPPDNVRVIQNRIPIPTKIPSLFTLHHPMDEMKPCGLDTMATPFHGTGQPSASMTPFFTNVHERVVFMGKPRSFQSQFWLIPSSNTIQPGVAESIESTAVQNEPIVVVVTFHTQHQKHALWFLRCAPALPRILPLWKQHGLNMNKLKQGLGEDKEEDDDEKRMDDDEMNNDWIQLPSNSPFVDMHAEISLFCVHDHLETLSGMEENPNPIKSKASNVFLATDIQETGDYLLCLVRPINSQEYRSMKIEDKRLYNSHLLSCYSIHPLSSGRFDLWSVSHHFQIPCQSAQPIQAAPISPPQYNIHELVSHIQSPSIPHGRFSKTIPWWITQALNPPLAQDILVCRVNESGGNLTSLNLFRGRFHWVDCVLPQSSSSSKRLDIISSRYAVLDRVDLLYLQEGQVDSVRVSINLRMVSSPVTEAALLAAGSALSGHVVPCSLGETIFHSPELRAGSDLSVTLEKSIDRSCACLALRLRSETVRIAQQLAMNSSNILSSCSLEDLEWFTLSKIFMTLFGVTNNLSTLNANDESNVQAWDDLLQSDYHQHYRDKKRLFGTPLEVQTSSHKGLHATWTNLFHHLNLSTLDSGFLDNPSLHSAIIFDALHVLYEDCKLSGGLRDRNWIRILGSLLYSLSSTKTSSMREYSDHYRGDLGDRLQLSFVDVISCHPYSTFLLHSDFAHPPCFHSWLENIMKKRGYDVGVKLLNGTCSSMRVLLCLYLMIFPFEDHNAKFSVIVQLLPAEGIRSIGSLIDMFTPGVGLPILEAVQRCCMNPPSPSSTNPWAMDAYNLIGRPDLGKIQASFHDGHDHSPSSKAVEMIDDPDKDGLVCVELYSSMIFPNDTRVNEAARLLRSSRPSFLHVERSSEVSDHAFEKLKQEKLLLLCRRKLALPLGRGMLTFGTVRSVRAEPIPIPKITLAGRIPPTNSILNLDGSLHPQDMSLWPDFHNGVAAGLRLHSAHDDHGLSININRAWIISNKPTRAPTSSPESGVDRSNNTANLAQSNHFHGGFLMALGLGGHLAALSITDIYEYLTQGVVTTTVGILLGMAANKKGTCDPSVTKVLCLHIPSLLPPTFATIEVASPVQTAAIAGIGLLYLKSRHRLMTEFLLKELGKRPTNVPPDRESYSLSCGLALGMINLSLGEENDLGIADLHIEERLHRYIIGGRVESESHYDSDSPDRLSQMGQGNESERTSLIQEGDAINIDVTAPGAILALGLIYIRSGNKSMASVVSLPDTLYHLDYVRPDLLFLRVVARSLILWDEIEPSDIWMEMQIPNIIKNLYKDFGTLAEHRSGIIDLKKYTSMGDELPQPVILNKEEHHFLDMQLIRQSYAFILSGSCFSLGLRFAGTGNIQAAAAVRKRIIQFVKLRDDNDPATIAQRPEKQIVDLCLSNAAVALGLIMAGTGDLDTFRLFRSLRWKCDETVKYGTHMAFGAAIGLLFLGGGSCTLGNEPAAIAALLVSFFPRFPINTGDNQYHLQALRHVYALAIKKRLVDAVDVESQESIFLPLEVEYDDISVVKRTAPCLLQNITHIKCLRVSCERYYSVEVDLTKFPPSKCNITLFVKRRCGYLSFQEDPDSLRTLQIQTGVSERSSFVDLIEPFIHGTPLSPYTKYLCNHAKNLDCNSFSRDFEGFCINALYQCLLLQMPELIQFYLSLYSNTIVRTRWQSLPMVDSWNLRLIRSYYDGHQCSSDDLISRDVVAAICEVVERRSSSKQNRNAAR